MREKAKAAEKLALEDGVIASARTTSSRTPADSRTVLSFPFHQEADLREQYSNPWGGIRIGKVMEDLDALAGYVSFRHTDDGDPATPPLTLVTASIDKVKFKHDIRLDQALELVAEVVWTGRASMDVAMEVISGGVCCVKSNFIFVARDPETNAAAPVNPLDPQDERELEAWRDAERRADARRTRADPDKHVITDTSAQLWGLSQVEESRVLKDLPALSRQKMDALLVTDTALQNTVITMPQEQNIHGRIFGGLLCRRAYELAFITAYSFSGLQPAFLEVDRVDFLEPVDIGDILQFSSRVLYSENRGVLGRGEQGVGYVEVQAVVISPDSVSSRRTNTFLFAFGFEGHIATVVPETMEQALKAHACASAARTLYE